MIIEDELTREQILSVLAVMGMGGDEPGGVSACSVMLDVLQLLGFSIEKLELLISEQFQNQNPQEFVEALEYEASLESVKMDKSFLIRRFCLENNCLSRYTLFDRSTLEQYAARSIGQEYLLRTFTEAVRSIGQAVDRSGKAELICQEFDAIVKAKQGG